MVYAFRFVCFYTSIKYLIFIKAPIIATATNICFTFLSNNKVTFYENPYLDNARETYLNISMPHGKTFASFYEHLGIIGEKLVF